MILEIIAGINIRLVTRSAPTIFIVVITTNERRLKNMKSKIFVFIPRDKATSLLSMIKSNLW